MKNYTNLQYDLLENFNNSHFSKPLLYISN